MVKFDVIRVGWCFDPFQRDGVDECVVVKTGKVEVAEQKMVG